MINGSGNHARVLLQDVLDAPGTGTTSHSFNDEAHSAFLNDFLEDLSFISNIVDCIPDGFSGDGSFLIGHLSLFGEKGDGYVVDAFLRTQIAFDYGDACCACHSLHAETYHLFFLQRGSSGGISRSFLLLSFACFFRGGCRRRCCDDNTRFLIFSGRSSLFFGENLFDLEAAVAARTLLSRTAEERLSLIARTSGISATTDGRFLFLFQPGR